MISKTIIVALFTILTSTSITFAQDECKNEADAYGRIQTITANLLNYLDNPTKMKEVTDYYGEQTQIANAYNKEGKYQEACDAYQEVIDKYDMKTIEEQYYEKHPDKRPENQQKAKNVEPEASSSAEAAVSAQDAAGEASGTVSGESATE